MAVFPKMADPIKRDLTGNAQTFSDSRTKPIKVSYCPECNRCFETYPLYQNSKSNFGSFPKHLPKGFPSYGKPRKICSKCEAKQFEEDNKQLEKDLISGVINLKEFNCKTEELKKSYQKKCSKQ